MVILSFLMDRLFNFFLDIYSFCRVHVAKVIQRFHEGIIKISQIKWYIHNYYYAMTTIIDY